MLLSIDVGTDSIYLCEGACRGGFVEIYKAAEAKLPAGTIVDGFLKNQSSLIAAVNKLLEAGRFKSSCAAVTFNSTAALSRILELPPSKPKQLAQMVRNEMMQVVSDSGDIAVEYSKIQETADKNAPVRLWAYSVPKEYVDEYYAMFKNMRLKPAALDIHPNSVEKLLANCRINGDDIGKKSVLLGDIGASGVEVHLFSRGERVFSRISPVSALDFEAVLKNMGYQKDKSPMESLDISPASLKKDAMLSDLVPQYFSRLADEFQKMIQFQLRRDSLIPVTNIYLYGGISQVKGISEYFSALLGMDVQVIQSVSRVKCAETVKIAKYLNAAGALIRL